MGDGSCHALTGRMGEWSVVARVRHWYGLHIIFAQGFGGGRSATLVGIVSRVMRERFERLPWRPPRSPPHVLSPTSTTSVFATERGHKVVATC